MKINILSLKPYFILLAIITLLLSLSNTFIAQNEVSTPPEKVPGEIQSNSSPFQTILKVLKSPRCMNCHPSDDQPRQGDDRHIHQLNVVRGVDNHGGPVQTCNTCHHVDNNIYTNVPGAPHWGLAPKSMGWQGLTDAELGRAILDKAKNGNRSPEEIVAHMSGDALVLWAWNPGEGRSVPPVPLNDFKKALNDWLADGTPVPEE
jgi:hypothetical protein